MVWCFMVSYCMVRDVRVGNGNVWSRAVWCGAAGADQYARMLMSFSISPGHRLFRSCLLLPGSGPGPRCSCAGLHLATVVSCMLHRLA